MRVLTIVNWLNIGGIETTLLSCVKNMHKKNPDVKMIICCFRRGGTYEQEFKKYGAEIVYIKKTGLITLDCLQLLSVIKKHRIDIVHSRFGFNSGGFILAAKLSGVKVITSYHSTNPSVYRISSLPILKQLLNFQLKIHQFLNLKFADKIIGHSRANLNANYKNWEQNKKFQVLYNGINIENFDADHDFSTKLSNFVKPEDFVIIHVGNFTPPKNHSFLIKVFHKFNTKFPNSKLILVGFGASRELLENLVQSLNLSEKVFFAGQDQKIKKYLQKADVFFFPSLFEGLGNVVLEAQYLGVPVCASDLPPLSESVYKDYHPYFFDPTNEEDALQKLTQIRNDIQENKLESSKADAKKFVIDQFSIRMMAENLVRLYQNLL